MSKKAPIIPLPKVKNIMEVTGRERSQLLIHFNQTQWEQAVKGAIDGGAQGLRMPEYGQFLISMPLLSGPHPNFPNGEPPVLSPPGWALMGLCHCNGDDKWCDIRWRKSSNAKSDDPLDFFDAQCQCFCPPDPPSPAAISCSLRITVSNETGGVSLDCIGECRSQEFWPPEDCRLVFWSVDLNLARFSFPIFWWTCACQVRNNDFRQI